LILSKNCGERPARVKWRCGTEVGAEFFTANSSSASPLTAGAPRVVKPRGGEGLKSESVMLLRAQAQEPDVAKLKADAREVVGSISGDKAKTEACRRITDLGGPIVQAAQEKDEKKAEALMQRINEWEKILGPEYSACFNALYEADPNSKDVHYARPVLSGITAGSVAVDS
jgi:hypothetical protein